MFFGSVKGINRLISKGMPNVYLRLKNLNININCHCPIEDHVLS